jgi:exodeoxyribonuclease VII large subunit
MREQLESRTAALGASFRTLLMRRRGRLEQLAGELGALSPVAILERGYALVFDSSGKLVKDSEQVQAGEEIRARVARGEIKAVVKKS